MDIWFPTTAKGTAAAVSLMVNKAGTVAGKFCLLPQKGYVVDVVLVIQRDTRFDAPERGRSSIFAPPTVFTRVAVHVSGQTPCFVMHTH